MGHVDSIGFRVRGFRPFLFFGFFRSLFWAVGLRLFQYCDAAGPHCNENYFLRYLFERCQGDDHVED